MSTDDPFARVRGHLPYGAPWRIAVVGAGSVGSQAADSLVRTGIQHVTLIDPDVVSAPNLSRSVYRRDDIGRCKVDALADHLRAVGGDDLDVVAFCEDVRCLLTPGGPVAGQDLVLLATDDPMAELEVNHACYPVGTSVVSVKMYRGAEAAETIWVAPHWRSPCLRCLTVGRSAEYERDTDYGTGRLVAEPALGPDIAVVVPQGVKTALALLAHRDATTAQDGSPDTALVRWFDHLGRSAKVMAVTATIPGWPLFAAMDDARLADPWATVWIRGTRSPNCPICAGSAKG